MHIYIITNQSWWDNFADKDYYESPTLAEEKFIHLCTAEQVDWVLENFYANQTNLLKLYINPDKLSAKMLFEASEDGTLYPHLYGSLNKDAVEKVETIK